MLRAFFIESHNQMKRTCEIILPLRTYCVPALQDGGERHRAPDRWQSRQGKGYEQWTADKAMHGKLVEKYSLENNVTPDTPPVFLAHCTDDSTVPVKNSIDFYMELVKNGVPAEMHIFPYGGHGWGFSTVEYTGYDGLGYARSEFEASLFRWMDSMREK